MYNMRLVLPTTAFAASFSNRVAAGALKFVTGLDQPQTGQAGRQGRSLFLTNDAFVQLSVEGSGNDAELFNVENQLVPRRHQAAIRCGNGADAFG